MNKRPEEGGLLKLPIVLVIFSIILSIAAISISVFNRQNEIVYVDAQKLVNGYQGMQDARKEFELKSSSWKSNLDTLRVELETKIKEYQSTATRLSAKEKSLMEELIQTKQEQFVNYEQIISEKVKKEDQELTTKVLSKVNDYVKQYGKEKGYAVIMAATQFGNIVYAEEHTDITAEVLKGLNAEYPK